MSDQPRLTKREREEIETAQARGWLRTRSRWRNAPFSAWIDVCRAEGRPLVIARQTSPRYGDVAFDLLSEDRVIGPSVWVEVGSLYPQIFSAWDTVRLSLAGRRWGTIDYIPTKLLDDCAEQLLAILSNPENIREVL